MKDVWSRSSRTGPVRGWSRRASPPPRDAPPAQLPGRAPSPAAAPDARGTGRFARRPRLPSP
jgi:hypothetical protein